ncbi:MAG: hypothetical protein A2201_07410 [Alicyclobacillus sp. RIFOXYA1_FULL_53_8]|nr:MAG: hypothetical protein A2201_07410 [Alicyclobacillus sp. RIFOXYA1_FULL_53_8]
MELCLLNDSDELILGADLEELKLGYAENDEYYTCLCCGEKVKLGVIYPEGGLLYEAKRYMQLHIEKEHQSVFHHLINLDKSVTGISEIQRKLISLFYEGHSDLEVQNLLGMGSTSTIRNHRFQLKEKERQARVFLAVMELLRKKASQPEKMVAKQQSLKSGVKRSDPSANAIGHEFEQGHKHGPEQERDHERDRRDRETVLRKYFPAGTDGPLKNFSMKEKYKLIIVKEISQRFEAGRIYTEKQVNQILQEIFEDYAVLRRYLVEYGFLTRLPDGSQYWLSASSGAGGVDNMGNTGNQSISGNIDRKQELKQLAKETKILAGVYQVKNVDNQKVFIDSTPNLKTVEGQKFQLETGSHRNKALQEEWNKFGKETFVFEVLETLEEKPEGRLDVKDALKKMKKKWLDKVQPFGDKGYNPLKDRE